MRDCSHSFPLGVITLLEDASAGHQMEAAVREADFLADCQICRVPFGKDMTQSKTP